MRKINFIFAIILISLLLLSVASIAFSQAIKKTFELPEFKSIYVNSSYTVLLKQSNKQEVIAEAAADIMELTTVVVDNGVLMVYLEPNPDNPHKSAWGKTNDIKITPTMKFFLNAKSITALQVYGVGKSISENLP